MVIEIDRSQKGIIIMNNKGRVQIGKIQKIH